MIFDLLCILAETIESNKKTGPNTFVIAGWTAVIALFAWTMLKRTRRRLNKSLAKNNISVEDRIKGQIPTTNVMYRQMGELMGELADLSRQINGQIDTRIARLDRLLRDANLTIAQLQQTINVANNIAKSEKPNTTKSLLDDLKPPPHTEDNNSNTDTTKNIVIENHSEPPLQEAIPAYEPPQRIVHSPEHTKDIQDVLTLAKTGKTPIEIAQTLQRPVGEIELILALNKHSESND